MSPLATCCVASCPNSSVGLELGASRSTGVSYFPFPRDPRLQLIWMHAVVMPKVSHVCSSHFQERDLYWFSLNPDAGSAPMGLNRNAVPLLNLSGGLVTAPQPQPSTEPSQNLPQPVLHAEKSVAAAAETIRVFNNASLPMRVERRVVQLSSDANDAAMNQVWIPESGSKKIVVNISSQEKNPLDDDNQFAAVPEDMKPPLECLPAQCDPKHNVAPSGSLISKSNLMKPRAQGMKAEEASTSQDLSRPAANVAVTSPISHHPSQKPQMVTDAHALKTIPHIHLQTSNGSTKAVALRSRIVLDSSVALGKDIHLNQLALRIRRDTSGDPGASTTAEVAAESSSSLTSGNASSTCEIQRKVTKKVAPILPKPIVQNVPTSADMQPVAVHDNYSGVPEMSASAPGVHQTAVGDPSNDQVSNQNLVSAPLLTYIMLINPASVPANFIATTGASSLTMNQATQQQSEQQSVGHEGQQLHTTSLHSQHSPSNDAHPDAWNSSKCIPQHVADGNETANVSQNESQKKFECDACGHKFEALESLRRHEAKWCPCVYENVCVTCEKVYARKSCLNRHCLMHHGGRSQVCRVCGGTYATRSQLNIHLKTHSEDRHYLCETCGKSFKFQSTLNHHRTFVHSDSDGKECVCNICSKSFKCRMSLQSHQRRHNRSKSHQCDVCGNVYPDATGLSRHKRLHGGEKLHKCVICGKAFHEKRVLRNHILTHTGEQPHQCKVCGRRFSQHSSMTTHQKTHTGEKPHQCGTCGRRFSLKSILKNHLKVHKAEQRNS